MTLDTLKEAVWAANLRLQRAGLVLLTWGNVSGYCQETKRMVIKPSGVDYAQLSPENMVVVAPDGRVEGSALRPSSDTPTHLALYAAFPGIGGVAHSHSTHAVAWAQARRPLPCYGTTHADHFRDQVPVTEDMTPDEIAAGYEAETGSVIVRAFQDASPYDVPGVLVAGHGPFTWGPTPDAAVENSIVLEEVARMALLTERLGGDRAIDAPLRDKHFLRKHGPGAYYGQGH